MSIFEYKSHLMIMEIYDALKFPSILLFEVIKIENFNDVYFKKILIHKAKVFTKNRLNEFRYDEWTVF